MKIRLDYVSVSVAGDYYQVMFEDKDEDERDEILDTPYVRTGGCRSRPGAWTEIIDPFRTFSLANKSNNLMMA